MTRPARQRRHPEPSPAPGAPRVVIEPALQDDPIAAREAEERVIDVLADILDAAERRRVG